MFFDVRLRKLRIGLCQNCVTFQIIQRRALQDLLFGFCSEISAGRESLFHTELDRFPPRAEFVMKDGSGCTGPPPSVVSEST
jgi:hypothetical protein